MKILKPLLLCLLFISYYQANSAPWTRINPLYTHSNLSQVSFNSRDTGLVRSADGELFYTYDGGYTWNRNEISENWFISNVTYIDKNTVFAFTDSGLALKSLNGGQTWTIMFQGEKHFFNGAKPSNNKVYLYGKNELFVANTADGLWKNVAELYGLEKDTLTDFFMYNDSLGSYTQRWGSRKYTTDCGKSWHNGNGFYFNLNNHIFSTKGTIYQKYKPYTASTYFGRSTDCGQTWETICPPDSHYTAFTYLTFYSDSLHGWRFVDSISYKNENADSINKSFKLFQYSNDAGFHWMNMKHPDQTNTINSMFFIDSLYGWVVGNLGYIYRTTDAGKSWDTIRNRNNSYPFFGDPIAAFFHTDSIGTVFARNSISRTYDKGNHWHQIYADTLVNIYSANIIDSLKFIISLHELLPYHGVTRQLILRSSDSCRNFEKIPSPLPSDYFAYFHKYDQGNLGPEGPFTSDAGKSWHYNPSYKNYFVLCFLTFDDTTYYWNTLNEMLSTTNKGAKWDTVGLSRISGCISKQYDNAHAQILFNRNNLHFQVANTYDKGRTWSYSDTITISGITPIYIQNEKTFWGISNDYKYIYKSKDGGYTWKKSLYIGHYKDKPQAIMHFLDDKRIWIFLEREGIFYTETGGE